MRKRVLTITFLMVSMISNAQTWQWVKQFGSNTGDAFDEVCLDGVGNIYGTGTYSSPYGIFGNDTLPSQGWYNIYINKIDTDGNFVWAKKAGGIDNSNTPFNHAKIYYDGFSNALLVSSAMSGYLQRIDTCTMTDDGVQGQRNYFLTKMDLDGNCIWTIDFLDIFIYNLSSDSGGNIYGLLTTKPQGSVFNGAFLQPGLYLTKLSAIDGTSFWTRKILNLNSSLSPIKYSGGGIYVSGGSSASGSFVIDTATISVQPYDIYIAKLDTTGSLQWVRTIGGGPDSETSAGLGTDANGNVYTCGTFENVIQIGDTALTAANGRDWFIAKYDGGGELIWARQASVVGAIGLDGITTDNLGNTYSTGSFDGSITFGAYSVTASTDNDGFLVKYDSNGICAGIKTYDISSYYGDSYPLADGSGSSYVVGEFEGITDFDGIQLTSYGVNDVFLAKIDLVTSVPAARLDGSNELLIYANPNSGKCTINVPDGLLNERNLILRIFDSSGKLIRQTPLAMNEGKIQLSLEQEAKGIYTATLSNSEKTYHGRIVFE